MKISLSKIMIVACAMGLTMSACAQNNKTVAKPQTNVVATKTVKTKTVKTMTVKKAATANINTASFKALSKVKGMSKSMANSILNYRKKYGNFKTTNDLLKVKGFTKAKFMKVKNNLTI